MAKTRLSRNPEVRQAQVEGRIDRVPADAPLYNQKGEEVHRAPKPAAGEGAAVHNDDGSYFPASTSMATGRETPRRPIKANRMADIEVRQGLRDPGEVNVNQGRLFSPQWEQENTVDVLAQHGVPPAPKSAAPGFLPRVGSSATQPYGTVAEARAAGDLKAARTVSKRKQEVIKRHGQEIGPTTRRPEEPDRSTPLKESVQRRLDYVTGREPHWYETDAGAAIEGAARRTGTTANEMRRAVAYGSPQMPWTSGHPQDGTFRMNNVEFAEQMARHVQAETAKKPKTTAEKVGKSFSAPAVWQGKPIVDPDSGTQMTSKVQTEGNRIKAASAFMGDDPSKTIQSDSQKVVNFDVNLTAASNSRTVRRNALNAYTADTWDERTQGISSRYAWTGATAPGGYDINAMTGRRAAMKAGRLPAQNQEDIWQSRRDEDAPVAQQALFTKSGRPTKTARAK